MKRLFVLLIALMLMLSAVTGVAYADETKYVLIENNSTNLYSDEACTNSSLLCTLPTTYYAALVSENETSYKVTFAGAVGYIKKSDVSAPQTDSLVASDYTNMVSKLSAKTTQNATLYDVATDDETSIAANTNFTYLGKRVRYGATLYYVKIGGNQFGYIMATDLPEFDPSSIPTYTKPAPTPSATAGASASASATSQNKPAESTNGVVKILLIIGICIPAVIIVYLLFKPAKAQDARYTGDEPKRNDRNDDDEYYQ